MRSLAAVRARLDAYGALAWAQRFCARLGVELDDVLGASRMPEHVRARAEMLRLLVDTLDLTYSEAGRIVGRDHATVRASILRDRERGAHP